MKIRITDIETGGFNKPHGVCECAYTDVERIAPGVWMITKQDTTLLKPVQRMSQSAIDTHGITDDMVANAPPDKFVSNFLHHESQFEYVAAHNWSFEEKWLDPRTAKPICTLICGKHLFPGFRSYKNFDLFTSLKCHESADMSMCEPLHRALPDTYVTAHIMLKLLEKASPDELVAITAGKPYGKKLPIGKFKGLEVDDKLIDLPYLQWLTKEPWVKRDLKEILDTEIERRKNA